MSLTNAKKDLEKEVGVSSAINISHLVSPSIFETRDGALGMVLKVKGVPFITATDKELNKHQNMVHQALLKIDASFILMSHLVRKKKEIALSGDFSEDFARQVDEKYHQRFKGKDLYSNELYWTLLLKNDTASFGKKSVSERLFSAAKKVNDMSVKSAIAEKREEGVRSLEAKAQELIALLSPFNARVLGLRDEEMGFSELLAFLSLVPNGGEEVRLFASTHFPHTTSPSHAEQYSKYPRGNLAQYLGNHRIFFGENIQFQGNSKEDTKFATMLSLKQYPKDSSCVSLDPVLAIEGELILSQTYAPIESTLAIKEIERCHSMKVSSEDYAASQIDELGALADAVASEKLRCGMHHTSLMLLSEDVASLERLVNDASKAFSMANMSLIRESMGLVPVFFAQIPANAAYIARASMITSENFADFSPLHNTQTGHHQENFLNSAITLFETPTKTPVFGNYHARGSKTNPSKGQGLIIGGNDSGKTTLAMVIDSQMNRFENHRSIILDRQCGTKIYVCAMNGVYSILSPEHKNECVMNPLMMQDSPLNRDFCKSWCEALLLREGEGGLSADILERVSEAVDYCFDVLTPESRTLSNLAKYFPVDFERKSELNKWLRGNDARGDGKFAWIFDNEEDALSLDAKRIGFDVTYVLDSMKQTESTPIFMYIMHRIELSLTGDVTSIIIDEFWQVLRAPYWKVWLEQRLPSIRKDGGHVVGMTQSPKTIVNSAISSELIDNAATIILFPNPEADRSIYVDKLGLSESEFRFIKNNNPSSRLFLYKHNGESIICKIDLSNMSDEIRVFSGNAKSVELFDAIVKEVGAKVENWLPLFIERSRK